MPPGSAIDRGGIQVFASWTDGPTMTRRQLDSIDLSSPGAFEAVIAEAIERAITNGVDVRGAWAFRTPGSTHNWEVEIYELATDSDDATD
jgi:hypothetical protein